MSDPTNLNKTSPGSFNQPIQPVENPLTSAQSNPATAAASAPPVAAPNVSTPISQTAGSGSAAASSQGLGGGVAIPTPGLGGGVSNPSPVIGDSLLPGTPGPSSGGSSSGVVAHYPDLATFVATAPASSYGITDDTNTLYILISGIPVPIVTTP